MNSINAAITGLKNLFGQAQTFVSNMTHEDYVKLSEKQGETIQNLTADYNRLLEAYNEVCHDNCRLTSSIQRAREALG